MARSFNLLDLDDYTIVLKRLRTAGLVDPTPMRFPHNPIIMENELRVLEKSIRKLGEETFRKIVENADRVTLYRQLARHHRKEGRSNKDSIYQFLAYITDPLSKIVNDRNLQKKGVKVELEMIADPPLKMRICAYVDGHGSHESRLIGKMNFNFFLNKKNRPVIMIGNFQWGKRVNAQHFEEKVGIRPINYFIQKFTNTFPSPEQITALNPKGHSYMGKGISSRAVAIRLEERGELTMDVVKALLRDDPIPRFAEEKIKNEIDRIRRQTPGVHNAAFKKAGFRISESDRRSRRYKHR